MIKNLIKWWPIIKTDSDWDWESILEILEFKLNKMADAFESEKAMAVGTEDRAKEMREASILCRKLIEDDFLDWDEWHKLHPDFPDKDPIDWLTSGSYKTPEQQEVYREKLLKIHEKEDQERQESLNQLCEILRTKILSWWD